MKKINIKKFGRNFMRRIKNIPQDIYIKLKISLYTFRINKFVYGSYLSPSNKKFLSRVSHGVVVFVIIVGALPAFLFTGLFEKSAQAASASSGPRSATATGDCVNDTGTGTVAWTSPGNAFSDNATYGSVSVDGTTSNYIKCTNFGFSIPTGVTIAGIVVSVERKSDSTGNGGSTDAAMRIVKAGTIGATDKSTATTYTTADVKEDHGGAADLWGETWTVSDVNASNFGAAFATRKASAAGAAHSVTVDVVQITVHYSFNPTFEQSSYRWFNNQDTSSVVTFAKEQGNNSYNQSRDVIETTDGGYVTAGNINQLASITKYNFLGQLTWTFTISLGVVSEYYALTEASDSSIIAVGYYTTDDIDPTKDKAMITKFNSSGVEQWTKSIGTTTALESYDDVIEASDGSLIVAGSTSSYGAGNNDLMIAKFNSSGVEQWTKTLGGTSSDVGNALVETSDGGIAVVGMSASYGTGNDIILAKFNSSGVEQWTKTISGSGNETAYDVIETSSGDLILSGTTTTYGTGGDAIIAKFNSSGVEQWTKTIGGISIEGYYALAEDTGGNIFAAGYTSTYGNGINDAFLTKFNSSGVEQWSKALGATGDNLSNRSVLISSDGGLVTTGSTGDTNSIAKYTADGDINNCGSDCTTITISETDRALTETDRTITESNQTLSEVTETVTEQANYETASDWVALAPTVDVSSALNSVAQDTATTALGDQQIFRLRMNLHVGTDPALAEGNFAFKLQYAQRGADNLCDTSFANETYADVTSGTPISFGDNTNAVDGQSLATNANDPAHSGHSIINQEYNESNNTSIVSTITAGQDGMWDFALKENNAPVSTTYCFRIVYSTGTTLNTYTVVPQITTQPVDFNQSSYRWLDNQDGGSSTFVNTFSSLGSGDILHNMTTDSNGDYIVTGQTNISVGDLEVIIAKFNSSGVEQWSKTWGTASGDDIGYGIASDASNNLYITGYTTSFSAASDMFITKFNSSGVEQWSKTWGGASSDQGGDLIIDSSGDIIITGRTNSYGAGSTDVFITKFNSSGVEQWSKTWGGTGSDIGYDITVDSSGNYIITGQTASYGAGSTDVFITKFNSSGVEQWSKTWGGTGSDTGNSIHVDTSGDYILVGLTASYGAGSNDMFITKFNSSGVEQWSKTWGGTGSDSGFKVIVDTSNQIVVGGSTSIIGSMLSKHSADGSIINCSSCVTQTITEADQVITEANQTITEANQTITETDRSITEANIALRVNIYCGESSFAKTWGGTGTDISYSSVVDSTGNYIITGSTTSYGAGSEDMFITKFSSSGVEQWSKTWGGTGSDIGYDITVDSSGNYIVTGSTTSYGTGGNVFIARFNSSGVEQDSSHWGGTSSEIGTSITTDASNNYIVTGSTSSYGTGGDMFILRFSNSLLGVSIAKTWGGSSADSGTDVLVNSAGEYIVTGSTSSYGAGSNDMFITKFNSSGVEQWSKTWGGTGSDAGNAITKDASDNYFVTGTTASYGAGSTDVFITKFNSSGVEQWSKTWGGTDSDEGLGISIDVSNNLFITGSTESFSTDIDMFITKFNSSGVEQWSSSFGDTAGSDNEYGNAVFIDTASNIAVSGYLDSFGAGGTDMLLTKYTTSGIVLDCSQCQVRSITEADQTITEADQTITEANQSTTYQQPGVTEADHSITEGNICNLQVVTIVDKGAALNGVSQNTAGTLSSRDIPIRLRLLLDPTKAITASGIADVKLQYALKTGTCDTSFIGETYADLGSGSGFVYYNNTTNVDGGAIGSNIYDPTDGNTTIYQTYEEGAPISNINAIAATGESGLWDLSMSINSTAFGGTYCFRIVQSDGSLLGSYTNIPEIYIPPSMEQLMRHGKWLDGGVKQPFYW